MTHWCTATIERIHVDDLAYATRFMHDLIATFATS